ncbi:hypothetical protein OG554_35115 [Streptomyces griseus]|uniref:hypothetical protein n=1 Tax=Streptomyces griseus TaxID=1911 RepID=UPI00386E5717|nr:hypothetical protein OG554_35115 [Streptomyces fimicarius]
MADEPIGANGVSTLAGADAPVFETLVQMTLDTFERSGLDAETYLLTRIAALVAMDAPPPRTCSTSAPPRNSACPGNGSRAPSWQSPPWSAAPAWCPPPAVSVKPSGFPCCPTVARKKER